MQCDFAIWQKTQVTANQAKGYIADLWKKGWNATFGPLPENTVGLTAGVAASARMPAIASPIKPINPALEKYIRMGRLQIYCLPVQGNDTVLCYNLYGWTGSQQRNDERDKGDQMFHECNCDVLQRGDVAAIYTGDINARITRYSSLSVLLAHHGWIDVGANATRWGGRNNEFTCKANEKAKTSRIDYVVANPRAQNMIKGFRTKFVTAIATHARLELDLKSDKNPDNINVQSKPDSLAKTIEQYIATHTANFDDDKASAKFETLTYERLKLHMDKEFQVVSAILKSHAQKGNTDVFWKTF